MVKLTLCERNGDDVTLGRRAIVFATVMLSVASAHAAEPRCSDASGDWRRRFERAAFAPELGVRATVSDREAAVLGWIAWPLDRAPPRGIGGAPSLAGRRHALGERARELAQKRRRILRADRVLALRDAVDAELDLEEIDAELRALEVCP